MLITTPVPSALAQGEQTPLALPAPVPALPVASSPIEQYAVSDERIRGIIQEQLLAVLDSPAVQQKIFAMLALETAVNLGIVGINRGTGLSKGRNETHGPAAFI